MDNNLDYEDIVASSVQVRIAPPEQDCITDQSYVDDSADPWYSWGADNNWPLNIQGLLKKNNLGPTVLENLTGVGFGQGVGYYTLGRDEKSTKVKNYPCIDEVESFIEDSELQINYIKHLTDIGYYNNAFPSLHMNRKGNYIPRVSHNEAFSMRLGKKKGGVVKNIYQKGDWQDDTEKYKTFPAVNDLDPLSSLLEYSKDKRRYDKPIVMHSYKHSPSRWFYKEPSWIGITRKGGWLHVANDIPEIIQSAHANSMTIKYHVQIPSSYYEWKHGDLKNGKPFSTLPPEKRKEIVDKTHKKIEDHLAGKQNTMKTLLTHLFYDETSGKYEGFKITPIGDVKENPFIPKAQEANIQLLAAFDYHPTHVGLSSGTSNLGGNGGSDKRVDMINMINRGNFKEVQCLRYLNVVARFNALSNPAWKNVRFEISHKIPTVLSEGVAEKTN